MKTFEYSFSAGETKVFPGGAFFMVLSTTAPIDVDFIKNNRKLDESGQDIEAGYKARPPEGFSRCDVTSATAQTVKVGITRGAGDYDRSQGEVDATLTRGTTIASKTVTVPTIEAQLCAADSTRRALWIQNLGSNAVFIGPTGLTTANGMRINPGMTFSLDAAPAAAVYARATSGTNDVRVFEEKD